MSKGEKRKSLSETLGRIAAASAALQDKENQDLEQAARRSAEAADKQKNLVALIDKYVRPAIKDAAKATTKSVVGPPEGEEYTIIEAVQGDGNTYKVKAYVTLSFRHPYVSGSTCTIAIGDDADHRVGFLNVCAINDILRRINRNVFYCVERICANTVSDLLKSDEEEARSVIEDAVSSALDKATSSQG